METFSFMPQPGDAERIRVRLGETRVWWVEFDAPVERVFCDTAHVAAVFNADYGIAWTGMETYHHPRQTPTDREGVWCMEFGIPIDRMAVEHQHMRGWMEVVRANGLRGRYREAGTTTVYEF